MWPFDIGFSTWQNSLKMHPSLACINRSFLFIIEYYPTVWTCHKNFFQIILPRLSWWLRAGQDKRERHGPEVREWSPHRGVSAVLDTAASKLNMQIHLKRVINKAWKSTASSRKVPGVVSSWTKEARWNVKVVKVWIMQTRLIWAHKWLKLKMVRLLPPPQECHRQRSEPASRCLRWLPLS